MRVGWIKFILVFAMTFGSGAVLMVVNHRVQNTQRQIAEIEKRIAGERESIRVLEAEWAYLNNPERLEKLAQEYLELVPAGAAQIVSRVQAVEEHLASEDVVSGGVDASLYQPAAYTASDVVSVVRSSKPKIVQISGHSRDGGHP